MEQNDLRLAEEAVGVVVDIVGRGPCASWRECFVGIQKKKIGSRRS